MRAYKTGTGGDSCSCSQWWDSVTSSGGGGLGEQACWQQDPARLGCITQWPLPTRGPTCRDLHRDPIQAAPSGRTWPLWPPPLPAPALTAAAEPEWPSPNLALTQFFYPAVNASLYFLEKVLHFLYWVLIITACD